MVHSILHGRVKRFLQIFLTDIVLVLTNADCLRIDLHKLCKRILHAPCDRDGTADRDIVVGQFLLCKLRSRVDGGTRLVRDEVVHVL